MLGLLFIAAALTGSSEGPPEIATFCEVAANPDKFTGREIVIRADFVTDRMERSVLFDPSCNKRKGIGVGQEIDAGALDAVLDYVKPLSTGGKDRVIASFLGSIVHEEPNDFTFYKDDGLRFAVRRVTDVEVRRNGS